MLNWKSTNDRAQLTATGHFIQFQKQLTDRTAHYNNITHHHHHHQNQPENQAGPRAPLSKITLLCKKSVAIRDCQINTIGCKCNRVRVGLKKERHHYAKLIQEEKKIQITTRHTTT